MGFCKYLTFIEMFCCFCGSIFVLAISSSVMYMVYFQHNPTTTESFDTPSNFGIRSSLRSEPRFRKNSSFVVTTEHALTYDIENNINDPQEGSEAQLLHKLSEVLKKIDPSQVCLVITQSS